MVFLKGENGWCLSGGGEDVRQTWRRSTLGQHLPSDKCYKNFRAFLVLRFLYTRIVSLGALRLRNESETFPEMEVVEEICPRACPSAATCGRAEFGADLRVSGMSMAAWPGMPQLLRSRVAASIRARVAF